MTRVVLATSNPGKVEEMQLTLKDLGFEVLPQSSFDLPEAVEDGLTFVENALKKARHACKLTEMPAIADDSGIEVDALWGAPGIYSARYADRAGDAANNKKLLQEMRDVSNRTARFQCVIVYMLHPEDPTPIICQGSWEGQIAQAPVGDNGFGYDPIFYIPELGRHSAELSADIKKQVSHRAKALAELKRHLHNRS
ncbi:MAG: XTP/dITP diphosphohydrolase [Arenicella sp.]|jgi:XTP/dITP diphosphohydrolase